MQRIEYQNTMDKSTWDRGPWDNEPDKIQWQDEATGLPCLIVRNNVGAWCGYVGVSKGHPFYGSHYSGERMGEKGRNYENSPDAIVTVHGGLTFSDFCHDDCPEDSSICHKVEPGENDKVWWLGFDCCHYGDLVPGVVASMRGYNAEGTYRDVAYIQAECASLAKQLKALMDKP